MPDSAEGLDPAFSAAIQALIAASHGELYIESGYRSVEEQTRLWNAAVAKYGSPEAARKWVAPPGHSNHNRGMAVDLGGNMELAHQLAPQFGLVFPMSWEPWHIEPVGAREKGSDNAYTTPPPGQQNPATDPSLGSQPAFVAAGLANAMYGALDPTGAGGAVTGGPALGSGDTGGAGNAAGGSGSYTPGGGPFGGVDQQKWATDFLGRLGMPVTSENIRAVTAWQQAESGGGGGKFNPLNTTQGGFAGETDLNSVGVKNYTSYEDGLAANIKVINNGLYQPILDALKQGDNAMNVAHAISQTPWGTGGLVAKILGSG